MAEGSNNNGMIALATAGITAVSLVTVALVNRPSATPAPQPSANASTGPTALIGNSSAAAPTGGGPVGPLHAIDIHNTCAQPFSVMFYFHGKQGWTSLDGASWDYAPGESNQPNDDNDKPLYTDRDEIYVRGLYKINGASMWDDSASVDVNGASLGFRKAAVKALESGEYQVELACDP